MLGNWIRGFAQFAGEGDAQTAELRAIETGLKTLPIQLFRSKIIIETDSTTAIDLILYNYSNQHPMRNILLNCRHLLSNLGDYLFF